MIECLRPALEEVAFASQHSHAISKLHAHMLGSALSWVFRDNTQGYVIVWTHMFTNAAHGELPNILVGAHGTIKTNHWVVSGILSRPSKPQNTCVTDQMEWFRTTAHFGENKSVMVIMTHTKVLLGKHGY